jgi:hypothetical protein
MSVDIDYPINSRHFISVRAALLPNRCTYDFVQSKSGLPLSRDSALAAVYPGSRIMQATPMIQSQRAVASGEGFNIESRRVTTVSDSFLR